MHRQAPTRQAGLALENRLTPGELDSPAKRPDVGFKTASYSGGAHYEAHFYREGYPGQ